MTTRRRYAVLALVLGTIAAAAGGCAGNAAAVPAFRAYYDAVTPAFLEYVHNDTSLSAADRSRRVQAVQSAGRFLAEAQH